MSEYIALGTELTAVADAIRAKGETSDPLTFPAGFVSAINSIQKGGGGGADVVFYDDLANNCRGGIVASYSAADFAELTEMPENPDHSNFSTHGISIPMTSKGWNWSLADAKTYVAKYGKLNIGQMYIPTDGKSHWICYVPEDAPVERWNTEIHISVSGGSVNWQIDDGATSTASGNISVTFPSVGWHDVKISAPSGVKYYPYYSSPSKTNEVIGKIQKIIQIFLGDNVSSIGYYSFRSYYSLTSVTIPDGVTSISSNAFQYCNSLTSITIPDGVTSIGSSMFYNCYSLTSITIPDGVTSIDSNAFYYCYSLTSITIPDSVTSIGGNAFYYCCSLTSFTIPDGVTSIGSNAFNSCCSLTSITIPDGVTSIDGNVFQYCYSLTSITIPDDVTSIGSNVFQSCNSLTSITIPDDVTSIGNTAFNNCYSLTSITIPDGVTSIGNNTFNSCYSLKNIIMESSTPPTLSDANAFGNLMSDYSIIVPAGSRSTYTSASNWSSLASHIVEASS